MQVKTTHILAEPISDTSPTGVVTALQVVGEYIAIALDNSEIHVFALDGHRKHSLKGCQGPVWTVAMHGNLLCAGGADTSIRIWSLLTGDQIHVLNGHKSTVRSLLFLGNTTLVSGSRDASIRIWDVQTGQCKQVLDSPHTATVRSLAAAASSFSSSQINNTVFVSGGYDGRACVWSSSNDIIECLRDFSGGHQGGIYTVEMSDSGEFALTGGLDAVLRVWDIQTGKCSTELHGHKSLITKIQILEDHNRILSADSTGSIYAWSLDAPHNLMYSTQTHANSVTSFAVNNPQTLIVSGGADGAVKLTDTYTGQVLARLVDDAEAVWKVALLEETRVVAAVSRGRKAFLEIVEFDLGQ